MKTSLLPFLTRVEQAIHYALQPEGIIRSFQAAGIVPFDPDVVLNNLPEVCPPYAVPMQVRKSKHLQISGKMLTSVEIVEGLQQKELTMEKKAERKKNRMRQKEAVRSEDCAESPPSSSDDEEEDDEVKEMREIEEENTWLKSQIPPVIVYDDSPECEEEEEAEKDDQSFGEMDEQLVCHPFSRAKRMKLTPEQEEELDFSWLD
jgi:hypothetical protein